MTSMDTIRAMADFIGQQFDVEKVILFGSYARGQARPGSDVDLLVVMAPNGGEARAAPILAAVGRRFCVPVDVVVRTPQAMEQFKNKRYSLVRQALKDGVVLYAH